jgi:predicted nuclease of restriction endonuclease-like (RecB) superfamily
VTPANLPVPSGYTAWLRDLKQRIRGARQRAVLAANAEQIQLYHDIGRELIERFDRDGWGTKVVDRLSRDLREAFPDMRGFSARNLHYMRDFAREYPSPLILQQTAAKLPWFHLVTLITKVSDPAQREWYAQAAVEQAWSRATLVGQIAGRLHLRQGAAVTNFERRLQGAQAGLAQAILKDPYHFDFLGLGEEAHERDIENALMRHITRFLLELGAGFAFIRRQYRLEVAGDEFFLDLLFYHARLKCYVAVELKARDFEPEQTGKLNFYLSAIDAQIKAPDDKPTIGLLLCRRKNRIVAEYALSGIDKPIGIAEYELVRALPAPLDTSLPTIETIEEELSRGLDNADDAEAGA